MVLLGDISKKTTISLGYPGHVFCHLLLACGNKASNFFMILVNFSKFTYRPFKGSASNICKFKFLDSPRK